MIWRGIVANLQRFLATAFLIVLRAAVTFLVTAFLTAGLVAATRVVVFLAGALLAVAVDFLAGALVAAFLAGALVGAFLAGALVATTFLAPPLELSTDLNVLPAAKRTPLEAAIFTGAPV